MRRKSVLALAVATASLIASVCFAMYSVADRGMWPDSWPKPLDRLRAQARTLDHGDFTVYEIPFTERAEFESAWPHILTVKSEHAPLVLLSSPDKSLGDSIAAGVRIRCPPTGRRVTLQGANYPPGSKSAIAEWWAFDRIELIVDGDIVDLNRIPLPADAPIIDKRFRIAMAPDGSSVRMAKVEPTMGTLDVGTADVERVLLSSEAGLVRFSGSGGGKWKVPAGHYTAIQARLSKTDAAGAKWRLSESGSGKREGFEIRAGETRALRLGPPLKTRIEARAAGDGSIVISLVLEGQAGEQYAPRAGKGDETPPPPKLRILDEAGKVLTAGTSAFG